MLYNRRTRQRHGKSNQLLQHRIFCVKQIGNKKGMYYSITTNPHNKTRIHGQQARNKHNTFMQCTTTDNPTNKHKIGETLLWLHIYTRKRMYITKTNIYTITQK